MNEEENKHKVHRITSASENQPWWNDGDKVGGMGATIVMIGLAILLCCICVALGVGVLRLFGVF